MLPVFLYDGCDICGRNFKLNQILYEWIEEWITCHRLCTWLKPPRGVLLQNLESIDKLSFNWRKKHHVLSGTGKSWRILDVE